MTAIRLSLAAAAAALLATMPATAQDVRVHHGEEDAGAVSVHRGMGGALGGAASARRGYRGGYAGLGWAPAGVGFGQTGYWEANYGREDDAAIFAARYGCARPIWNAKYNRYTAPCN